MSVTSYWRKCIVLVSSLYLNCITVVFRCTRRKRKKIWVGKPKNQNVLMSAFRGLCFFGFPNQKLLKYHWVLRKTHDLFFSLSYIYAPLWSSPFHSMIPQKAINPYLHILLFNHVFYNSEHCAAVWLNCLFPYAKLPRECLAVFFKNTHTDKAEILSGKNSSLQCADYILTH